MTLNNSQSTLACTTDGDGSPMSAVRQ